MEQDDFGQANERIYYMMEKFSDGIFYLFLFMGIPLIIQMFSQL